MSKEAEEKCNLELAKLEAMPMQSAEATVSRNYLDVMLSLPWDQYSEQSVSLKRALAILDEEHYGVEEVKEHILEYLAVQKRNGLLKQKISTRRATKKTRAAKKTKPVKVTGTGTILCIVGPPGTGKTSIGKSVARAVGREYRRISLGGIRDEAEIRGHRRTYVGAMPGKLIQCFN